MLLAEAPASAAPRMAISIHDVAPETWPLCARLIAMVDAIARVPLTLLVVPDFHHRGEITGASAFRRNIDDRLARGDEAVLHGYFHWDDAPAPANPKAWFERRVLTRCEGEFSALDADEAGRRLELGLALFHRMHWPPPGFVPPAWLLGRAAALALQAYGLRYVALRRGILIGARPWLARTTTLVYSPHAAWRRVASRAMMIAENALAPPGALLRLALHPADAKYPQVMAHWVALIERYLDSHMPVTKGEWADQERLMRAPLVSSV